MAELIAELEKLVQADKSKILDDRHQHRKALQLARSLCTQLETPIDHILRISWAIPTYVASLQTCIDLRVFDVIGNSGKDISVDEISAAVKADRALLQRLLRQLAAMGALDESGPGVYRGTSFSAALQSDDISSGISLWFVLFGPISMTLPRFLAENGYKNPTNPAQSNWKLARNTDLTFFESMKGNPHDMGLFAKHMSTYSSNQAFWLDIYPVDRLLHDMDKGKPLLVDVGGGLGHDAQRFKKLCPKASGRICVQDLPTVIAKTAPTPDVDFMSHDFFTEQPVKGARCYYLHSILHDWPHEKAIEILQNLKPAFTERYSKLIINECVLPPTGADSVSTTLDMIMMGLLSSCERPQADWEKLISEAGYRITGIWTDTNLAYQSVIEAEPI